MGKKKNMKSRCDTSKQISSSKRNEINLECEKLFHISSDPSYLNKLWDNYLEISNILEKIKALEKTKMKYVERFDAIEEFIFWLKQNGAQINGIKIHNFPKYELGLKAEDSFNENELILEIPRKLIFNVHTAASEIKDIETDVLIQSMPYIGLAIALLIEKKKNKSEWKSYLNILPREYNTVLYMTVDDMIELKGSPILESVLKHCRNIARQYSYFYKIIQNSKNSMSEILKDTFTYEEYRWAVSTVMTRQNIIPSEDNSQMIHSLIPMWDMCNHGEGKITTHFNTISNCCECFSMRDFKPGDQIFIYYGPRTNSEFFLHSGFIYDDNKNDRFKLRLGISKVDPLRKKRIELLTKLGLSSVNEYFLKPEPEPMCTSLLGFLRIFNMNITELEYWLNCNNTSDILKRDCILHENIDKIVLKFIITRLKLLLSNYSTSEQVDVELIKKKKNCRKLIIQMRLFEKKLLRSIITILEKKYNK